jgi:hypothetical protein
LAELNLWFYLGEHDDTSIIQSGLGTQKVMAVGVFDGREKLDLILALLDESRPRRF